MDKIKIHKISRVTTAVLTNHVTKKEWEYLPDPLAIEKLNEIIATVNGLTQIVSDLIKEHGSKKYTVDDVFEMETDAEGHDLQCSHEITGKCDCWKDPEIAKASSESVAKMKGERKEK